MSEVSFCGDTKKEENAAGNETTSAEEEDFTAIGDVDDLPF